MRKLLHEFRPVTGVHRRKVIGTHLLAKELLIREFLLVPEWVRCPCVRINFGIWEHPRSEPKLRAFDRADKEIDNAERVGHAFRTILGVVQRTIGRAVEEESDE